MPLTTAAAPIVFGATLVLRGLFDDGRGIGETPLGWVVVQGVGFTFALVLAWRSFRHWRSSEVVWDERLRLRFLTAASSGFATMLALAAAFLVASPFVLLSDLAVAYLQVGTGILTVGVVLWDRGSQK